MNTKRQKYNARRTEAADGQVFDSGVEARRYEQLRVLEEQGVICDLAWKKRDLRLVLLEAFVDPWSGEKVRAITYTADFRYREEPDGHWIFEDVKGAETRDFQLRFKMARSRYPGFEFRIKPAKEV
jgi:hypothetical protein